MVLQSPRAALASGEEQAPHLQGLFPGRELELAYVTGVKTSAG